MTEDRPNAQLTEGFEFLGHRVRLRWDDRWGYWPRIEIPKARVKDFHHRIKQSHDIPLRHIILKILKFLSIFGYDPRLDPQSGNFV